MYYAGGNHGYYTFSDFKVVDTLILRLFYCFIHILQYSQYFGVLYGMGKTLKHL